MQAGGSGFDPHQLHHIPIGPRVRAPAKEAGEVGSIPAWEEFNELLVIEATNDNAQIENNSYVSFSRVCVRLSLVLDRN